ncbi:MAG: acyl-CoA reductase, partial [Chitinophagaceae bacterium]
MNLQERINLLSKLGEYIQSDNTEWLEAKEKASWGNGWFIPEFVELAAGNISTIFLQAKALTEWADHYQLSATN